MKYTAIDMTTGQVLEGRKFDKYHYAEVTGNDINENYVESMFTWELALELVNKWNMQGSKYKYFVNY